MVDPGSAIYDTNPIRGIIITTESIVAAFSDSHKITTCKSYAYRQWSMAGQATEYIISDRYIDDTIDM